MTDIEELATAIHETGLLNLPLSDPLDVDCHDAARAVLASGWFARPGVDAGAWWTPEAVEDRRRVRLAAAHREREAGK